MKAWSMSSVLLRAIGVLFLAAGILKAHELLTVPVANKDIWSYRPFLVFQVEFELAMGIWLLMGVFKRAAWLVTLGCFCVFCLVALYKGVTGAASCGCFGTVHVNPWITFAAIDLPIVLALILIRPRKAVCAWRVFLRRVYRNISGGILNRGQREGVWGAPLFRLLKPYTLPKLSVLAVGVVMVVGISTPILALNEPAQVTSKYEVLEPDTWIGNSLPIQDHIDVQAEIKQGSWLIVFYHYDCPDCAKAIPMYEQMARDLKGNEDILRISLVEVPPYGQGLVRVESPCLLGKMDESKEWFVTTPAVVLLADGQVARAWDGEAPELEAILPYLGQ